jgi:chitodextrinase
MKKNVLLLISLCALFTVNSMAQVYPPQRALIFEAQPNVSNPGYLQSFTDPTLGSVTTKIAASGSLGNATLLTHIYSKMQPWNADGSLIIFEGGPAAILNGTTFEFIKTVFPPSNYYTWSQTQPNILYGTENNTNTFVKVDVNTNQKTIIRAFPEYAVVEYGKYEGSMSNDDRYVALYGSGGTNGSQVFCYDLVNNTVVSRKSVGDINNCAMSQSGNYVCIQYANGGGGIWAYDRATMTNARQVAVTDGGHYDYGYDISGNEVCVGQISGCAIGMTRLDNGTVTNLISCGLSSSPIHISCRNTKRPGYAYLSDFPVSYQNPSAANWQKLYAVKLDPAASGNALTETYGFAHHNTAGTDTYRNNPMAVPSPNGAYMMFHSDWGRTAELVSYVCRMPGNNSAVAVGGDVVPPSKPGGLTSSAITTNSFTLSWAASTDNVAVTGYDVFRNGVLFGSTTTATNLSITGLSAATTYTMTVKAKDAAGNLSAASAPLSVTTTGLTNMLVNPGFESGTTAWTTWGTPTIVTSNQRSGTNCNQVATNWDGDCQAINSGFSVGNNFTYKAWFKFAAAGGSGGGNIIYQCFNGSSQVSIGTTPVPSSIGTTYTQFTVSFTVAPTTTQIRVSFENLSNQLMYVDDAELNNTSGSSVAVGLNSALDLTRNEPENGLKLTVTPNPMTDNARIFISSPVDDPLTVSIYDMNGKIVFRKQVAGRYNEIRLNSLPGKTMYILKVTNGKKLVKEKKIIQL